MDGFHRLREDAAAVGSWYPTSSRAWYGALRKLDPTAQAVLRMRYGVYGKWRNREPGYEGPMRGWEVAEELGMRLGKVYQAQYRALRELRELLTEPDAPRRVRAARQRPLKPALQPGVAAVGLASALSDFRLSARTRSLLEERGVRTVGELAALTEGELRASPYCEGRSRPVAEVYARVLRPLGLGFAAREDAVA